jgi:hypothetical protein
MSTIRSASVDVMSERITSTSTLRAMAGHVRVPRAIVRFTLPTVWVRFDQSSNVVGTGAPAAPAAAIQIVII